MAKEHGAAVGGKNIKGARWGGAWVALTAALALHVIDEALTDFLSVWNLAVFRISEVFPWSPLPTFSFSVWASGLALLVTVLALLARYALRGARWLRPFAYIFGIVMILNGLGHLALSVYLGRVAPGAYSAPLLLVAAGWLLFSLLRSRSES